MTREELKALLLRIRQAALFIDTRSERDQILAEFDASQEELRRLKKQLKVEELRFRFQEIAKVKARQERDSLEQENERLQAYLDSQQKPTGNQDYFWTPEWQKGEREADEDIKAGRVYPGHGIWKDRPSSDFEYLNLDGSADIKVQSTAEEKLTLPEAEVLREILRGTLQNHCYLDDNQGIQEDELIAGILKWHEDAKVLAKSYKVLFSDDGKTIHIWTENDDRDKD